jgi:hypothetical protein
MFILIKFGIVISYTLVCQWVISHYLNEITLNGINCFKRKTLRRN